MKWTCVDHRRRKYILCFDYIVVVVVYVCSCHLIINSLLILRAISYHIICICRRQTRKQLYIKYLFETTTLRTCNQTQSVNCRRNNNNNNTNTLSHKARACTRRREQSRASDKIRHINSFLLLLLLLVELLC